MLDPTTQALLWHDAAAREERRRAIPQAIAVHRSGELRDVSVTEPLRALVAVAERQRLRARREALRQVGNMKRFDPGIAFARRFIREELGQMLALKAWYCDSTYRYTRTENLQPLPVTSGLAHKPAGNPKADKRRYDRLTHGSHLVDTARFLGSVLGKRYLPWFFKSSDVKCFSTKDGQYHRPLGEDARFYKRQVEGFADSILKKQPLQGATVADGVAAMRAMVAIARSVATGERVQLAEVTGSV